MAADSRKWSLANLAISPAPLLKNMLDSAKVWLDNACRTLAVSQLLVSLCAPQFSAASPLRIKAGASALHQVGREFSGIAWAGGHRYYAVENRENALYPLDVAVDADGALSCSVGTPVVLAGAVDPEGCAWDAAAGTVWVSMEDTDTPVREYDPATGEALRSAPVPQVQVKRRRANFGLEALAISGDGLALWTCNEEALDCDGDRATAACGTVVRVTRFTRADVRAEWRADGQWAYRADPLRSDTPTPVSAPRSGVAALCALPDDTLLALEREISGVSIRTRIYALDFSGADSIESKTALAGQTFAAVSKTLLWEDIGRWSFSGSSHLANYEGLCLGPVAADGSASLFIVADGGNGGAPRIRHLTLHGLPPPDGGAEKRN